MLEGRPGLLPRLGRDLGLTVVQAACAAIWSVSYSIGVRRPRACCRRRRWYVRSIQVMIARRSSWRVAQRLWLRTFFCRRLTNDSIAALLAHAATLSIDPRSRLRASIWTYARERNWVNSTGRRNTLFWEILIGRPVGWICSLTGRSPMKSPGAPRHRREIEREFWRVIAMGVTSEVAAITVGVALVVGCRWCRHGGGMRPFSLVESSDRYLTFSRKFSR